MKENISYFAIEGRKEMDKINNAAKSLLCSQHRFPTKACKLFAPKQPTIKTNHTIDYFQIPVLDLSQHARWFINEIGKSVETDYVITVEWDGFVIHPESWTDEFLEYDFVGAPWPKAFKNRNRVGNGGFTLWSKKLLNLLGSFKNEEIPYGPTPMYDHLICIYMYRMLQKAGIKFAPVDVAVRFSVENKLEDFKIEHIRPFGFHGERNDVTKKYIKHLN